MAISWTNTWRWGDWLLSSKLPMRPYVALTLMATAVYMVAWVLIAFGMAQGMIEFGEGVFTIAVGTIYAIVIYWCVRSGWSQRFKDPGLTQVQLVMGLNFCGMGYVIAGPMRSCVLSVVALILTFGIFSLQPKAARNMALYAVVLIGVAMLCLILRQPKMYSPSNELFYFLLTATIVPAISTLAARLNRLRSKLRDQRNKLTQALNKIQEFASIDELTGLSNRRHMMQQFEHLLKRCRRTGQVLSIALVDLDYFKHVNDRYGHAVGDQALCVFSQCVSQQMRKTDCLARWGGEEFLLLLPQTDATNAQIILQRVRDAMAQTRVTPEQAQLRIRFSAGVTHTQGGHSIENLLERADKALYIAKAQGRDRTVLDASLLLPETPSTLRGSSG